MVKINKFGNNVQHNIYDYKYVIVLHVYIMFMFSIFNLKNHVILSHMHSSYIFYLFNLLSKTDACSFCWAISNLVLASVFTAQMRNLQN
jgi:hypothetical protein